MVDPRKDVSRGAAGASRNSTWTRLATIALAVGMMAALAAPAWGQSDDLTLRRDGSKAVPVVAQVGPSIDDSSTAPTSSGESSGFHWGDAAIGVGLGAAVTLLTMGAVIAVRRRSTTRAASAAAAR